MAKGCEIIVVLNTTALRWQIGMSTWVTLEPVRVWSLDEIMPAAPDPLFYATVLASLWHWFTALGQTNISGYYIYPLRFAKSPTFKRKRGTGLESWC